MKCPHLIVVKNSYGQVREVPCGQCAACRLNKAREWSIRIMNEMNYYDASCFLTLTYEDSNLPENRSLVKKDLQNFLKRFRNEFSYPIRYYASGEYGEETHRPHYHLIVFGVSCDNPVFKNRKFSRSKKGKVGYECHLDSWPQGLAYVGDVTYDSACYVAKYTMKKVKGKKAYEAYEAKGIQPEFSLMSLKPGIGARYLRDNHNRLKMRKYVIGKNGCKVGLPRYYRDKLFSPIEKDLMAQKFMVESHEQLRNRAFEVGKHVLDLDRDIAVGRENIMNSFIEMKGKTHEIKGVD